MCVCIYICIYIYIYVCVCVCDICISGYQMILDISVLNTQHYKVRIKGKVEQSNPREGVVPPLNLWCRSY